MLDVIAIGPHPDDVELSMGGTLLALKAQGYRTGIIDLTSGEPTPFGDAETRAKEAARAAEILGLDARYTLDLPNRWLHDTSEGRIKLAEVIRRERPKLVFIPYWDDAHPDHLAGHNLAIGGLFAARLTKTEIEGEPHRTPRFFHHVATHLWLNVRASFALDITGFLDRKMQACRAYKSQFGMSERGQSIPRKVEAIGRYWGALVGTEAAEPFATKEQVGLRSIRDLL